MKKHHAVGEPLVPHNKATLDETWKGDKSPSVAANCCGCMWFFSANLSQIRIRNRPFDAWLRQFQVSGAHAKSIAPGAPTLFAQGRRLPDYQCQRMVHEGRAIVRRHRCVSGVRVPGKVVDNPWGRSLRPKCLRPANSRHRPDTEAASGADLKGFGRWSSVCSALVCWALIAAE